VIEDILYESGVGFIYLRKKLVMSYNKELGRLAEGKTEMRSLSLYLFSMLLSA